MKTAHAAPAFFLLLLLGAGVARASAENPLSKVIELLDSLIGKTTKDAEAEEKAFKAFSDWCEGVSKNKNFEIKTASEKKDKLDATISKMSADAETASAKIEDLAGSISTQDADLKSATTIREKEAADFIANEAELMSVIDTLGRAVSIIEREMSQNPAALAQVDASNLNSVLESLSVVVDAASFPSADKQRLLALMQSQQGGGADDAEVDAPAPAAYKTHSAGISDLLEDLREKAEDQLNSLRKAEMNTRQNFEMLKQSLVDQSKADMVDMEEEKAAKASAEETKATSEGELAATVKDLADAEETLKTSTTNCLQSATDHEATVAGRKEELKVLAEAKSVLQDTSAGAVSKTYSMLQVRSSTRAGAAPRSHEHSTRADVVTFVKRLSKQQHSAALAQLASRIAAAVRLGSAAGADPFEKVKGMISQMLSKLLGEAKGEATEKAYCDEQLAKTEEKKGELNADVSTLSAKIDQAAAKSAELKEGVKELQMELAALTKQQAEMDKIRQDSHAAYVSSKADLELGLEGVRNALSMLRDYYGPGASAAALLQSADEMRAMMQQPAASELYTKATGAGASIIGLLEVCMSDFAKNLSEVELEEADAATECDKMTQANKVTKALKDQDMTYKTQQFKGLDKSISDLSADRETTDTELSAVLDFDTKIKERCIAKPGTYEERKKRRQAEIEGLKEALTTLEDDTAFTQRRKRGRHGRFLGLTQQ